MKKKLVSLVMAAAMAASVAALPAFAGETEAAVDPSQDSGEIYMFIASPEYADAINTLIDDYKSDQPLMKTIDPGVASAMASAKEGGGMYGIAIKGNYFGMIYNEDVLKDAGVDKVPETTEELKAACDKIKSAGYTPFTTGFMEVGL